MTCSRSGGDVSALNQMAREGRAMDDLGRCDVEVRRSKQRDCQHEDYELGYKHIEKESSVSCLN